MSKNEFRQNLFKFNNFICTVLYTCHGLEVMLNVGAKWCIGKHIGFHMKVGSSRSLCCFLRQETLLHIVSLRAGV